MKKKVLDLINHNSSRVSKKKATRNHFKKRWLTRVGYYPSDEQVDEFRVLVKDSKTTKIDLDKRETKYVKFKNIRYKVIFDSKLNEVVTILPI